MTLTADQLRAMKIGEPIRVKIAEDDTEYVGVRADVFESLCDIEMHDLRPSETYAASWEVAGPAGWDDPEMDEFDKLGATP